ncbi:hypothetical protein CRG98_006377 [Punica granatum]|uniref:Uncharacterized protein n=1 Tax=Punica granatum TaxID=22663 RepID=A0A2I0KXP9_PUNGR|nr:hypothetical protein CRG98_006377 [Punica granatum]
MGFPGRSIHGQVIGTGKRACTHPRTTRTMEQVSDCLSGLVLVSRVSPDPGRDPSQTRSSAQSSFGGKLTSEYRTTHSLQLLGLGKSFRLGPSSCTFEAIHERLDLSLRSLRSLISPGAVVGVDVSTSFSPSCHCRCSRVFTAHSVQPSLPTPKATFPTLSSHPEARNVRDLGGEVPWIGCTKGSSRPPSMEGGREIPWFAREMARIDVKDHPRSKGVKETSWPSPLEDGRVLLDPSWV